MQIDRSSLPPTGRCSRTRLQERTPNRSTHARTKPTAISSTDAAVPIPRMPAPGVPEHASGRVVADRVPQCTEPRIPRPRP